MEQICRSVEQSFSHNHLPLSVFEVTQEGDIKMGWEEHGVMFVVKRDLSEIQLVNKNGCPGPRYKIGSRDPENSIFIQMASQISMGCA